MKEIALTQGKVALVDDEDYELLSAYKWSLYNLKASKRLMYAQRWNHGKPHITLMHRVILGVTDPKVRIDHKDHNGLNNQKANLRLATASANGGNELKSVFPRSSRYKGVSYYKRTGCWYARIRFQGVAYHLGYFYDEAAAAQAYDAAAILYFGEFACVNFTRI